MSRIKNVLARLFPQTFQFFEVTDRYQALGIPYPDLETMCKGQCDGTGFYPIKLIDYGHGNYVSQDEETDEAEKQEWLRVHNLPNAHLNCFTKTLEECDGWHFIQCADCGGTGLKKEKK